MKIENIDSTQMNNGGHYNFVEKQIAHLEEYQSVSKKLPPLLTELKTKFNVEAAHLKTFQKNPLTDKITAADKKRDSLFVGMKAGVRGFFHHPSAEKVDTAKLLDHVFKEYGITPGIQLDKETGLMDNLLNDLLTKFASQVALLGLSEYVEALAEANKELKALTAERQDQQSHVVVGALKAARKATDVAYKAIIEMINSLMVVEGEEKYKELVIKLNGEIIHAKRQVLGIHATGNTAGGDSDAGDNTGGNDDDDVPQG
ncbi:MAG: DUF6261 family protein [Prevotellaceae bacterium]|jgi:hypothetical protein|nr:DUF6261 family protein [Prevotellaceae bacterium]